MAKPLFDVLADSPEFFVVRGNTRADIILFAIGLVFVPPTLLAAVEAILLRWPRVREWVHLAFVVGLISIFALQLLDEALGGSSAVLLALSGVLALAAGAAYARTRLVPTILTVLAPAPIVFLAIFLLLSPVSDLVLPQDSAGSARADVSADTPVVWITLDELDTNLLLDSRGQIDRTRFPNFAALADTATWYRNATTISGQTTRAVPAQLTGVRPAHDDLPIEADHPNNVFTLLGTRYDVRAMESATALCPERICGERERDGFAGRMGSLVSDLGVVSLHLVLPEGLRSGLPAVDRTFGDFQDEGRDAAEVEEAAYVGEGAGDPRRGLSRAAEFDQLFAGLGRKGERPSFDYMHVFLPHIPWQYLPSGQQYLAGEPDTPGLHEEVWSDDPVTARMGLQRHMLQTGFVDRMIGRLMARLRRTGMFDRAIVVVSADHGVSYRPGTPRRRPIRATLSDLAAVPLIIKFPGQRRGRVDDAAASTLDIVPTLARVLNTTLPWDTDGRPLQDEDRPASAVAVEWEGDDSITVPFETFVRDRQAGLLRLLGLLGSDDGGAGFYAPREHADLLDRPVAQFDVGSGPPVRVTLDNAQLYDDVPARPRLVPSLVAGGVEGKLDPGEPVAVAVNGRIRGVTETFRWEDGIRFGGMVAPTAFRPGANRIGFYLVDGTRLLALEAERGDYRLVRRDGGSVIAGAGEELPVRPDWVVGFVDRAEVDDAAMEIGGWAVARAAKRPAERVLIFNEDRFLGQVKPTEPREDVAKTFKTDAATLSGYRLRVAATGLNASTLRAYGVYDGVASELPLYSSD